MGVTQRSRPLAFLSLRRSRSREAARIFPVPAVREGLRPAPALRPRGRLFGTGH